LSPRTSGTTTRYPWKASILFWLDHGRDQHVFAFASADSLARLPVLAFRDERAEVGSLRVDQSVTDLCGLANLGPGPMSSRGSWARLRVAALAMPRLSMYPTTATVAQIQKNRASMLGLVDAAIASPIS